jgi:hypothetical protein
VRGSTQMRDAPSANTAWLVHLEADLDEAMERRR